MSATTALAQNAHGRLGVMVRTPEEVWVYWETTLPVSVTVRVADLSGRPAPESLDRRGYRDLTGQDGKSGLYVGNLLPGHLYFVELGEQRDGRFRPFMGAGPVQTPWRPAGDTADFPAPYHRS